MWSALTTALRPLRPTLTSCWHDYRLQWWRRLKGRTSLVSGWTFVSNEKCLFFHLFPSGFATHFGSNTSSSLSPISCMSSFITSKHFIFSLPHFRFLGICISSVFLPTWSSSRRFIWPYHLSLDCLTFCNINTLSAKDGDLRLSASNACLPKTEISVFVTECVFFTSTCYKLHMFTLHVVLYS